MDVHKKKDISSISSKQKDINEHKFAAHVENLMEKKNGKEHLLDISM